MIQSGFSLLELIVVIAILGLIVSLVAVAPIRRQSSADRVQITVQAALTTGHELVERDSLNDEGTRYITAYPSGIVVIDTIRSRGNVIRDNSSDR